jgi:hypothetical protein
VKRRPSRPELAAAFAGVSAMVSAFTIGGQAGAGLCLTGSGLLLAAAVHEDLRHREMGSKPE